LLYPDGRHFNRGDRRFAPGGSAGDLAPPSETPVAAFDYLARNQARIAPELFATLAREAPGIFPGFAGHYPGELERLLSTPEGMMGAVEFEGPVFRLDAEDGCVRVAFPFHSDLLDAEHGVAVLMHRDRVIEIGGRDVLF